MALETNTAVQKTGPPTETKHTVKQLFQHRPGKLSGTHRVKNGCSLRESSNVLQLLTRFIKRAKMDASPEAFHPENKWNLLPNTADLVARHPGYPAKKESNQNPHPTITAVY